MTEPTAGAVFKRLDTYPLDALTPYPGNARRGDVAMILESLTANGQYRPLVVREQEDGTLVVLAGNHTMAALQRHGPGPCGQERPCALCHGRQWQPTAHCAVYHCDDATARRIVLADNRTSDAGTYDEQALADLLAALDGDYTGTGYTDHDLTDLLEYLEETAEEDPAPYKTPQPEETAHQQPPTPAAPAPHAADATTPPAGQPATPSKDHPTPPAPDRTCLALTYPAADRDEATRLITAAQDILPGLDPAQIVLRALRTLVAVIDSRHSPDGVVTVAALLKAAGHTP